MMESSRKNIKFRHEFIGAFDVDQLGALSVADLAGLGVSWPNQSLPTPTAAALETVRALEARHSPGPAQVVLVRLRNGMSLNKCLGSAHLIESGILNPSPPSVELALLHVLRRKGGT